MSDSTISTAYPKPAKMERAILKSHKSSRQNLPIELWAMVIRFVIYIPGELGISEWIGNDDRLELGRKGIDQLTAPTSLVKMGIRLRLNLSLVSRIWNQLMRKWIYQSIVIDSHHRVQMLHWVISNSPERAALIRRLDVSYEYMYTNRWSTSTHPDASRTFPMLLDILERCSNLCIVTDPSSALEWDSSCDRLMFALSRDRISILDRLGLEQIMFSSRGYAERHDITQVLGRRHQHLRALQLSKLHAHPSQDSESISLPKLELLNIAKLDLPEIDGWLSKWHLPNLHSVTLSVRYHKVERNIENYTLATFWKHFGSQIRSLCVQDWYSNVTYASQNYGLLLSTSKGQYPNFSSLQQLIVPIWIPEEVLVGVAVGTIRDLGVYWRYKVDFMNESFPDIFILRLIPDHTVFKIFPHLRLFHFTYIPNITSPSSEAGVQIDSHGRKRLQHLLKYLDAYEETIQTRGISIRMTMANGCDIRCTAELREAFIGLQREKCIWN